MTFGTWTYKLGFLFAASAPAVAAEGDSVAEKINFGGDLRLRFDRISKEDTDTRSRARIRARLNGDARISDDLSVRLGLATGEDADHTSNNQTLGDSFSGKGFHLYQAFADWNIAGSGAHLLAGKMANPLESALKNDLIFDSDLNPEGAAVKFKGGSDRLEFTVVSGVFAVREEEKDHDITLFAEQASVKFAANAFWAKLGANYHYYTNVEGAAPLGDGSGNGNQVIGGVYGEEYKAYGVFAEAGVEVAGLPVAVGFELITNYTESADHRAWLAGLEVGKTKNAGSFSVGYNYRTLGADSVMGAFTDSDFAGGGVNHKGHKFYAGYMLANSVKANVAYVLAATDIDDGLDYHRVQADLILSF